MKKLIKSTAVIGAMALATSSYAQLQDEKNVTIMMDLQPILQLKMEGPDQIDFVFDQINEYYTGITKYGATTLKVSSTVSFDLWAAGLSNGSVGNLLWDNPVSYDDAGGATDVNTIPVTALELRQFPTNPSVAAGCAVLDGSHSTYANAFTAYTAAVPPTAINSNNNVYAPGATTPYTSPTSTAANTSQKYIAGGTGVGANCFVAGGTYLLQAALGTSAYRYVMDYRIVPGLPVVFPAHELTGGNLAAADRVAAEAAAALGAGQYAQPGVYTMYVKYILAQDQ